jgi:SnoaL-like domain
VAETDNSALQVLIDRQAITDLLYRYSDIVTRAAWDEDEALFVDDAVIEIAAPFDARIEGAEAIRAWRASTGSFEVLFHITFAPSIRHLTSDRAQVTSQSLEMVRGPAAAESEPLNSAFRSIYYDDIVKRDAAWQFARRRCRPIYVEPGAVAGQTLAVRATLKRFPD